MESETQAHAVEELAAEIARQVVADLVRQVRDGADHVVVFRLPPRYSVSLQCQKLKGLRKFFASFSSDFYTRTYKATRVQALTKRYLEERGYYCRWIERCEVVARYETRMVATLLVALHPVLLEKGEAEVRENLDRYESPFKMDAIWRDPAGNRYTVIQVNDKPGGIVALRDTWTGRVVTGFEDLLRSPFGMGLTEEKL